MNIRKVIQILTGITLLIGIVWFINAPDYEPALTSVAILAALIGEFVEEKISGIRSVDLEIFKKLKDTLPSSGSIKFIDENNMAGFSFALSNLNDLDNFYYNWNNPEHEFLTTKLEEKRKKLHELIGNYLKCIAFNTFPAHRPGMNTVPPEWEHTNPEKFNEVVNELHDLAGEIVETHHDLFRTARKKLKC